MTHVTSVKGTAFLIVCLLTVGVLGSKQYERYCDQMIQQAGVAASNHNAGNVAGANEAVQNVRNLFSKAVSLQPNEPQAYLNMAVFLSNVHEYDESIAQFEKARSLLGTTIPRQVESQINMGVRRAKYGKFSMLRDKAYAQGAGNMTEAYHWALQQLTVSNELSRIHHEVATLEVMLCEYEQEYCEKASKRFNTASLIAQGLYVQIRQPDVKKEAKLGCLHSKMVLGDFRKAVELPPHLAVDIQEVASGLFFNKVNEECLVHGNDGVMTFTDEKHCHVATATSDSFTDLGRTVLRQPPHSDGQSALTLTGNVLSLLQFSGAAFYHWMCEVVPRLAVAKMVLGSELSQVQVLVPSIQGVPPPFVVATLQTFFSDVIRAENVIAHPPEGTTKFSSGVQFVSWTRQPCPTTYAVDSEALQCASLAHGTALRAARDIFAQQLPIRSERYVLISGRGKDTTMRNFNERKLVDAVRSALPADVDVRLFDASQQTLPESLALFRGALGVIGVHGGALSNLMACSSTTFVVEIGMPTIGAQQYRHVSAELGLRYEFIAVLPDPMKRSIGAPSVEFDADTVREVVARTFGATDAALDAEDL